MPETVRLCNAGKFLWFNRNIFLLNIRPVPSAAGDETVTLVGNQVIAEVRTCENSSVIPGNDGRVL